jgi:hypothetical protein
MIERIPSRVPDSSPTGSPDDRRYVAWFQELDAWTEYWDIYHPETHGRYYFGDGKHEIGLLTQFLPRDGYPKAFLAWTRMALLSDAATCFVNAVREPDVAAAVMEVDTLIGNLFNQHFGNANDPVVQLDYLKAIFRFATDSLPPAIERDSLVAEDDPRKLTAGRHTLDGDIMWFAWALHTEAVYAIVGEDSDHARRTLFIAAVAIGCAANFAWRGHRRTRPAYSPDDVTEHLGTSIN